MGRALLLAVRVGLPVGMVLAGVGLILFGDEIAAGAGVFTIGAAGLVALFNVFLQMGNRSHADRAREEAARDHYATHGRWPGER